MHFKMAQRSRYIFIVLTMLAICVSYVMFVSVSWAQDSDDEGSYKPLNTVLGDIEWRDTKDDVLLKLRTQMLAELQKDAHYQRDRILLHKARESVIKQLEEIEKSYTQLEGERTPYDVSAVAEEFRKNNGETLLRVRDQYAHRYFIFIDGRLYRLVIVYNSEFASDIAFKDFVVSTAYRYGDPQDTEVIIDKDGQEEPIMASWSDTFTHLAIKNRSDMFSTYMMVFTDIVVQRRLDAAAERDASRPADTAVSPRVESVMQGSGVDPNENVVDSLVGEVNVDLRFPGERRQRGEGDKKKTSDESGRDRSDNSKKPTGLQKKESRDALDRINTNSDVLVY